MALNSMHPLYGDNSQDWVTMRDLYKGSRHVKSKGQTYLPATKGMKLDGMGTTAPPNGANQNVSGRKKLGQEQYDAYLSRAVFPDYVKMAIEAYIGLLHNKPPTIELPPQLEPLRERATREGEPLTLLLRRMNEEQLLTGRLGILLDLPVNPDPSNPMPYIALYVAESIRNWDADEIGDDRTSLNLVVLDESGFRRTEDFWWQPVAKYRVLQLGLLDVNEASVDETEPSGTSEPVYQMGVFVNEGGVAPAFDPTQMKTPLIRGQALEEIPFVFVNTKDIVPSPDTPPLMGLAEVVLAIYRGEADYRQNLFMQGQDTLAVIGDRKKITTDDPANDAPVRTGAGSMIEMEQGGEVKYVGVESQGLVEQRTALENDRKLAETKAGQLINNRQGGEKESGTALQTRIAAQTATLNQIALTSAAALERLLKMCAVWMGADENAVKVTPNLEFGSVELDGDTMLKYMTAKQMGFPISLESLHALAVDKNLTKMDFKTEMDTIEQEKALIPPMPGSPAGGPTPLPNQTPPAKVP